MLRGWTNRTLGKWELPAAYLPVRKLIQGKSRQSKLIQGKLKIIPHLIFRIPNTWSGKILKVNPLYCRSPEAKMNSVSVTWWSTVLHLSSQINQVWIFFLIWISKNQRTNFRRSRFSIRYLVWRTLMQFAGTGPIVFFYGEYVTELNFLKLPDKSTSRKSRNMKSIYASLRHGLL